MLLSICTCPHQAVIDSIRIGIFCYGEGLGLPLKKSTTKDIQKNNCWSGKNSRLHVLELGCVYAAVLVRVMPPGRDLQLSEAKA